MKITFQRIKKSTIFCKEFENLKTNNEVSLSTRGIAIIYGPNGTGKTSLTRVLQKEKGTECSFQVDDNTVPHTEDSPFYIIHDQIGRNIIEGKTDDFVLGDNVRREIELRGLIDNEFTKLRESLTSSLKENFGISTKTNKLIDYIDNPKLADFTRALANRLSKGGKINIDEFIKVVGQLALLPIPKVDEIKFKYFVNDFGSEKSVLSQIKNIIPKEIKAEPKINHIGMNKEAIRILEKYSNLDNCIICENKIDPLAILERKRKENETIVNQLDKGVRTILTELIPTIDPQNDPFQILSALMDLLEKNRSETFINLLTEIDFYKEIFHRLINNTFFGSLDKSDLEKNISEYSKILEQKPEFSGEEISFIEQFINGCLNRKIELKRDENNNLLLLFDNRLLLNQDRKELPLSNGEQNFISLAFELLKAKKIKGQFTILDDPISSFDSIYKNKIIYALLNFLRDQNQIVLTHNTELIRLVEHQEASCFNLYLLNNSEGEENGFIHVNDSEKELLLYIHKLLDFLRNGIKEQILDEQSFLISVTPFIRSYCQLINENQYRDQLTLLMHGYNTEEVNVSKIYNDVLKTDIIQNQHIVTANNIVTQDIDHLKIINSDKYPLLSKTLRHSFTYLYLRLIVEKKLVIKFNINTKRNDQLSSIINAAFSDKNDQKTLQSRAFLFSRKTLLNEFNHFEADMNIFQPAIDITDRALAKEKEEIIHFINNL